MRRRNRSTRLLSGLLLYCLATPVYAQKAVEQTLAQVQALLERGDVAAAEKQLRSAAASYPNSFAVHNDLGTLYLQTRRTKEALKEFRLAVRLNPKHADLQRNLGTCYFLENAFSDALVPLERAKALDATDLRTRYQLGYSLLMLDRPQEAEPELKYVSDRMPDDELSAFALVKAYQAERDQEKAAATFARLQAAHPDSVFVHILLGEAYDIQEKASDAIAEYQKAIALAPEMPRLHFDLGFLYFQNNQVPHAVEMLEMELQINPRFAPALYYLGEISLEQSDFQKAASHFQQAIQQNATCVDAYVGLGKAHARAGHPKEALVALGQANRLDSQQAEIHYLLANVYRDLNQPEKRVEELRRFEALQAKTAPQPDRIPATRRTVATCLAVVRSKPK